MEGKGRAQLLVLLLALVCAGAVGGMVWYRNRPISLEDQIRRMPRQQTILLHIDFAALREAGILQMVAGTKATEDVDYQRFVLDTAFDYQQDLDSATIGFAPTGNYMLIGGRFDWKKLRAYAEGHGGVCYAANCQMVGSKPERRISFLPVQTRLMALAVSTDDNAVVRLNESPFAGTVPALPNAPIWLGLPGSVLKTGEELPSGTKMFARTMQEAEYVTIGIGREGSRFAAKLDVQCRSAQDALQIAGELTRITGMLREMIVRESQKPNSADLSGVLTSGTFSAQGLHVSGYWPIERSFLENILNGGVS